MGDRTGSPVGRRRQRESRDEPAARLWQSPRAPDSAGVSDLAAAEQHLHAAVHPWLEGAGLCPALRCGDREFADDFCVLGKAPAAEMLAAVIRLMEGLKLPINAEKTRCFRCPEESLEFLGYRIVWNYRPGSESRYVGTRPSGSSVQSICRRISEQTDRSLGWLEAEEVVGRLNRMISGWANYFNLGQVSPAYRAVDQHAVSRLRQWFCQKHRVQSGSTCASQTRGCERDTASRALRRQTDTFLGRRRDRD